MGRPLHVKAQGLLLPGASSADGDADLAVRDIAQSRFVRPSAVCPGRDAWSQWQDVAPGASALAETIKGD
jgi:hypothetical protein